MDTLINWLDDKTHIVYNPLLEFQFNPPVELLGHIWVRSSGTTGSPKWIALSKKSFLVAAKAANLHLNSTQKDVWLNVLPPFHVGGLSIEARSYLSGAQVIGQTKWSPDKFFENCKLATLSSLVPTQVSDLVSKKLKAPSSLRAIIVGGGQLSEELYHRARKLGWPLLPSFGMTECCSQVATASLKSLSEESYPRLELLCHIEARLDQDLLELKSEALCTGIWIDPHYIKTGEWFRTEDRVELQSRSLRPLGRVDDQLKIKGELVNLHRLQSLIPEVYLLALPHARDQYEIVGVIELTQDVWEIEKDILVFNKKCLPFERITKIYQVHQIPRTDLGKVQKSKLLSTFKTN